MTNREIADALVLHFPSPFTLTTSSDIFDLVAGGRFIMGTVGTKEIVHQPSLFDICWRIANEERKWELIAVERTIGGNVRGHLFTDTTPDETSLSFVTFTELAQNEYGIALALCLLKSRGVDIGDEDE